MISGLDQMISAYFDQNEQNPLFMLRGPITAKLAPFFAIEYADDTARVAACWFICTRAHTFKYCSNRNRQNAAIRTPPSISMAYFHPPISVHRLCCCFHNHPGVGVLSRGTRPEPARPKRGQGRPPPRSRIPRSNARRRCPTACITA